MNSPSEAARAGCEIPGMMNFGNTCFANSILQALANCSSFMTYLRDVELAIHCCRLPRLWTGCFNAPNLWLAKGPLVQALEDCLDRLQPRKAGKMVSASALEVLHALVKHNQKPFVHNEQQQDICEALESILTALEVEVKTWLEIQENPFASRQMECYNQLKSKNVKYAIKSNWHILQNFPLLGPRDARYHYQVKLQMQKLVQQHPFDGLMAHALECTVCSHKFSTRMTPHVALMIPIPEVEQDGRYLTVADGFSLEDSLDAYFKVRDQGPIACPKCSLVSSLVQMVQGSDRAFVDTFGAAAEKVRLACKLSGAPWACVHQKAQSEDDTQDCISISTIRTSEHRIVSTPARQERLGGLKCLIQGSSGWSELGIKGCKAPSLEIENLDKGAVRPPSKRNRLKWDVMQEAIEAIEADQNNSSTFESLKQAMGEVKLEWVEEKSMVIAKTLIGKLPQVLAISIQRRIFTAWGYTKIHGRVKFPNQIDISRYLNAPAPRGARYRLQSLIVHQGDHNGGHYFTVRRLQSGGQVNWVMASDMRVETLDDEVVKNLECSMLLYERINDPIHEETSCQSLFLSFN